MSLEGPQNSLPTEEKILTPEAVEAILEKVRDINEPGTGVYGTGGVHGEYMTRIEHNIVSALSQRFWLAASILKNGISGGRPHLENNFWETYQKKPSGISSTPEIKSEIKKEEVFISGHT